MNTPLIFNHGAKLIPLALAAMSFSSLSHAGDGKAAVVPPEALQTRKDVPADFHKYFGQRINSWKDKERQIAKLDMDADMNQDGVLSNTDPADSGAFEVTPPGMVLGRGEMTRVVVRLLPYRVDFDGEVVVTLEVEGINRSHVSGEFASLDEEIASMGHIRVWRDSQRKELLLDSRDPAKRVVEFTTQYRTYPYNLPIAVPRTVFVEGVKTSPLHTGDVRLLMTVSHRGIGQQTAALPPDVELSSAKSAAKVPVAAEAPREVVIKSFRTSFDHILFTVQNDPLPKEFINGNNEGVWIAPSAKGY